MTLCKELRTGCVESKLAEEGWVGRQGTTCVAELSEKEGLHAGFE